MVSIDDKITLTLLLFGLYFANGLNWQATTQLNINSYWLTKEFNVAITPRAATFQLWGTIFLSSIIVCFGLFGLADPKRVISRSYSVNYEQNVVTFATTVAVCDIAYIALLHATESLWLPFVVELILWCIVYQAYHQIHQSDVRFFFQLCTSLIYAWSTWELSFVFCALFQLSALASYGVLSFMFANITWQSLRYRDWMVSMSVVYILAGIVTK